MGEHHFSEPPGSTQSVQPTAPSVVPVASPDATSGVSALPSGSGSVVPLHVDGEASELVEDLEQAVQILERLLQECDGNASSYQVTKELDKQGFNEPREMLKRLKYYFDDPEVARWHHQGRSFYSREKFENRKREQEEKADQAEMESSAYAVQADTTLERPKRRQEEARLGSYIVAALENIYQSDFGSSDAPYVFDVHNARGGSHYENVDILSVHWRSDSVVELVTVEVKLEFTSLLVQQAKNYCRFSHRVWIAVPLAGAAADAAERLRATNELLFEHVVDSGLGILACLKRVGRSFEVVPVHWPRRFEPDNLEKQALVERYREQFEDARVVPPTGQGQYPRV